MTTSLTLERSFPRRAATARAARRFVADALEQGGLQVWPVDLATSELVTNAVENVAGPVHVRIRIAGTVRVEVADCGPGIPVVPDRSPDRERGRGLMIVDAVSTHWGVERTATGKTVWFVVPAVAEASTELSAEVSTELSAEVSTDAPTEGPATRTAG